jgi:flagellar hook protein FlgE
VAGGTFGFDLTGKLTAQTPGALVFNPINATQAQPLTINLGDPTPPGTGLLGITQFAAPSGTASVGQDGYTSGSLTHVAIDKEGKINGSFTNGQSRVLGQVATALVKAPDKMDRVGGNLFAVNPQSGQATLGAAGTAGRGGIVAGALEQSNVDLANEFVRMIAAQRGYQASSKTVTTADQLLAELMTLKR